MKRCISIALLIVTFCAVSVQASELFAVENRTKYIAYYFHGTQRCVTCQKIEELSRKAVQDSFGNELKNGILLFKTINVEEPQNRHFVVDFKLYTQALIITMVAGDRTENFRNLSKVWELVYSPAGFTQYVKTEISAFIGGNR